VITIIFDEVIMVVFEYNVLLLIGLTLYPNEMVILLIDILLIAILSCLMCYLVYYLLYFSMLDVALS
jgi:hypothetical protein